MPRTRNAPYPFTFDTSSQSGSPIVVSRGDGARDLDIFLQTNRGGPATASIISAFGMDAGAPVDNSGRALTGRSQLFVDASFDVFGTFFFAMAIFNSVHSEATVNLFVEEFDPSGNFVRGIDGPEHVIFREGGWWVSAEVRASPSLSSVVIPWPQEFEIVTQPRFRYRVWIDLRARVQGAGFSFGGSGAIAQAVVRLQSVTTWFEAA